MKWKAGLRFLLPTLLLGTLATSCAHNHGDCERKKCCDKGEKHECKKGDHADCGKGHCPKGKAQANLAPLGNHKAHGDIKVYQEGKDLVVKGWVKGLKPNQHHGFHIHAKGDCSSPDGKSAGGHFNPTGASHGELHDHSSHAGDLGNIHSNASGKAEFTIRKPHVALTGDQGVVGRAFIVHAGQDDLKSQPSGAAGPRIACGVIKAKSAGGSKVL